MKQNLIANHLNLKIYNLTGRRCNTDTDNHVWEYIRLQTVTAVYSNLHDVIAALNRGML